MPSGMMSGERVLNLMIGLGGKTLVSGSSPVTASVQGTSYYYHIHVVSDAVFTTLADTTMDGVSYSGMTFPAGSDLYGQFTIVKLASGIVLAYKS
jgi:hypothetical protein